MTMYYMFNVLYHYHFCKKVNLKTKQNTQVTSKPQRIMHTLNDQFLVLFYNFVKRAFH